MSDLRLRPSRHPRPLPGVWDRGEAFAHLMRRKLFNLAAALSLLLTVAVCVLWVRSYWTADVAGFWSRTGVPISDTIWSSTGYVSLRHWEPPANSKVQVLSRGWFYGSQSSAADDNSRFLGQGDADRLVPVSYYNFTWPTRGGPFDGVRERVLLVPYWFLLAVTGTLPIVHFLSRRRRRRAARAAAGLCPACGYDLRATPDRCPECGTLTNPAPAK